MLDRVIQPTDHTCFAASVSMLTGIDIGLLPDDPDMAPDILRNKFGNYEALTGPDTALGQWVELLDSLGYALKPMDDRPAVGIALVVMVMEDDWAGHAVVVDDGNIIDPSPSDVFQGCTIEDIEDSCNAFIPCCGYMTVERKS